ncbi:hypothetical protein BDE36_3820 [Arcticibacter tournemirensis]|nr:hypothetical protein BDE36_3820 [Arcticibacter tournemirensis]
MWKTFMEIVNKLYHTRLCALIHVLLYKTEYSGIFL